MTIRNDEDGMRAALACSARGRGLTSPRPSVGCVIVRDGEIIGKETLSPAMETRTPK
jgi:diaminohydroxyphosphoribosylaminopyrimidine deaminase/5-amino-6-(5-phosphoribosylamino)uracil reductase